MTELTHWGIKGQKWGVRNGPPYPLKPSDRSSTEKKASIKDGSKNKNNGKSITNKALSRIKSKSVGEVDPELASMAASAIASAISIMTTVIALKVVPNVMNNRDIKNNIESNNTNIQKRIKGPHTEDRDMADVNKAFHNTPKKENHMNCVMCTTAYELRRRGYDVKANVTEIGRYPKDISKYFNMSKQDHHQTNKYSKFVKQINNEPEGARGNVIAQVGPFASNHSMVWEKKNGKIIIRDAQSNEKYPSIEDSIINKKGRNFHYFRTDDKTINWDRIRDAVVEY